MYRFLAQNNFRHGTNISGALNDGYEQNWACYNGIHHPAMVRVFTNHYNLKMIEIYSGA